MQPGDEFNSHFIPLNSIMEEAIKNFASQFSFEPVVENGENLKTDYKHMILSGMGGSHLAAGLLKARIPGLELYVHRNYGLPSYSEAFLQDSLLIASSYSGNTEEVISFLDEGLAKGYNMAVISTGGVLIEKAQEFNVPYIQLPDAGIQPRSALGYATISLVTFLGNAEVLGELSHLAETLDPASFEQEGRSIAENMKGKVPVIYASLENLAVAYNWKIKYNETAKIPAFYNILPELNHNEMTGFDPTEKTEDLIHHFRFIMLRDRDDHERIQKRMDVLEKLLEQRGLEVISLELEGNSFFEKIFNSLLIADWATLHTSYMYNTEPEQVPMVEEFKSLMTD